MQKAGEQVKPLIPMLLTEREKKQIEYQRNMKFGRLTVIIQNEEPVVAEEPLKQIKF